MAGKFKQSLAPKNHLMIPQHQTFIGNCITAFDDDGECIDDRLPWSDVTEFAQYIDEFGDNTTTETFTVAYDADSDVHSFFI